MLFLARSALCIGVVAALLPDTGRVTAQAALPGAVPSASGVASSATRLAGQRGRSDQTGRLALAKLAGALVDRRGVAPEPASVARDAAVRFGLHAMLERATEN